MRATVAGPVAGPVVAGVTVLLAAAGGTLALGNGAPPAGLGHLLSVAACAAVGGLVLRHRPGHPVGVLLLGSAACFAALEAGGQAAVRTGVAALAWPQTWLWVPANAGIALAPVFFPDGRLPSPRWRPAAIVFGVLAAVAALTGALRPGPNDQVATSRVPNPLGVAGLQPVADAAGVAFTLAAGAVFVAGGAAVLVAAHRARGVRRQQARWVAYALALTAAVVLGRLAAGLLDDRPGRVWPAPDGPWDVAGAAATTLVPVAVGVAILRHRLFDIDVLIGRTAVFGALSVVVGGSYLAVVAVLGAVEVGGLPGSLAGAAVAAVLFAPARHRLQRRVNLWLYGERDNPYAVLRRLGERLDTVREPGAVLATAAATLREALQLSYVGIEVAGGPSYGTGQRPGRVEEVPLVVAAETVGRLLVGPRPGERELGGRDRRTLADLARPIAGAAHAARLTADLRRSREQLVVAREEERRRLRRDLHDGLGPTLAGLTMRAEAAQETPEPAAARRLLDEVVADARTAVADVRRLVDGLRPAALDTIGLVAAVRTHLAGWPGGGPAVRVEAAGELPELPAATEVAAYRIAVEAVTNARRHAAAGRVAVTFAVAGGRLVLTVADDGRGLPADRRDGVGLPSMRERAAELGGELTLAARPGGGTEIRADLPAVMEG
ncbi:sensor histidine kinase [Spirilliplanes yamanashiensis]|uniref:Oxygen sensor histidine kinase NreB n=1 Tax=Spirilliplanes yamanashiensis TaxID=42233 RepID=A0A8J3YAV1_9ACTN|nr:sensor histidine kinase [Spirilliplanes yamanashiensis]MDP9817632.1 signal transduction histidine kinase [Spirilliplanes yamanashiensis]GIJ04442.1 hypothetical protein Sya03_37940 [Spirilliplanes yamanashiensis]